MMAGELSGSENGWKGNCLGLKNEERGIVLGCKMTGGELSWAAK